MPAKATPPFSWSYTRDRTLAECERRYFYQYYAAYGGWRPDAPVESRLAYELKQLMTLDMVLGREVHARAREIALAIQLHHEPPCLAIIRERTRRALNAVYRESCVSAADRAGARRRGVLREIYYGGGVEPEKIARIRTKMEQCLSALVGSSVWDEVRQCSPADIRLIDTPSTFRLAEVDAYAVPDLLYRCNCVWTIVDWKTGSTADVTRQLALYALFIRQMLRLPNDASQLVVKVVVLSEGRDEVVPITSEDLEAVASWAKESVGRMRHLLVDIDANVPAPRESFAMTSRWPLCQRCNYLRCCAAELGWGDVR
jgi:hypothetical protein